MSDTDAQRLVERTDAVLDILVAGDYYSVIHSLEAPKAELLDITREGAESLPKRHKVPREI